LYFTTGSGISHITIVHIKRDALHLSQSKYTFSSNFTISGALYSFVFNENITALLPGYFSGMYSSVYRLKLEFQLIEL
jgi:hypothetical protein